MEVENRITGHTNRLTTGLGKDNFSIVEFNQSHINQAIRIVLDNYNMERELVPELPAFDQLPEDLLPQYEHFASNGLSVAAMDGEEMIGFLCAYMPIEDAFTTTGVRGTFSPIHGHGVISTISGQLRDRIYSKLYQEAARKWVDAGIRSHAIALFTYDKEAESSFFYNGFGLRCLDLIRSLEHGIEINNPVDQNLEIECIELPRQDLKYLLELHNGIHTHLGESPSFMYFPLMDEAQLYAHASEDVRYFTAKKDGEYIAYIKLAEEGENYATCVEGMVNICGGYCRKEYRSLGIVQKLLDYMIAVLQKEGYQLLGVDCESFNPTARGFWTKYFKEYTHSLVRRIDEKAVDEAMKKVQK